MQGILAMDEPRQLKVSLELVDWLLPTVAHDDHWLQEEAPWTPFREIVRRYTASGMASGHIFRGHLPYRHGCPLRRVLHVRQVVPGS